MSNKDDELTGQEEIKCKTRSCQNDLCFETIQDLLDHHNEYHPSVRWATEKCSKMKCKFCCKCSKLYYLDGRLCEHLLKKGISSNNEEYAISKEHYPKCPWSITITVSKGGLIIIFINLQYHLY
jgi:hypothetical protein